MAESEQCQFPRCTRVYALIYLKKRLCDQHWHEYADEKNDKLREKLGLEPMSITKYAIPIGDIDKISDTTPSPKDEFLARRAKAQKKEVEEVSVEPIETIIPTITIEDETTTTETEEVTVSETQNIQSKPAAKKKALRDTKYGRDPETGLSLTKDGKVRKGRSDKGKARGTGKEVTE